MSESRDRDAAVEQWLRHLSPVEAGLTPSEECLDAETMAAWIDRSLTGAARTDAEAHVAGCARCQAIAATIARTESIADWSAPARPRRRWLTWVVPLSAAAIVTAVILVERRDVDRSRQTAQEGSQVAESRPVTPPAEVQSGLRSEPKNESGLAKSDQQKRAAESQKPAGAREEDERKALRDKAPPARSTDTFDAVAPKKPAAAPVPAPSTGRASNQNAAASQARADESARTPELRSRQAEAVEIDIRTPDPAVRWRIAGVRVERSIDAGSSWTPVLTGVTAEITAGAAASASVCWLVGRSGLVLLTTNGAAWQRLAFPEPTDLSAIRATDARNATVTTADGRQFSTTDGGRTWVRRDLQETPAASF